MPFKYETHLHTSEASACAISSGAEMADAHKKSGYTGIIVTDHFFNGNTAIPFDLSWKNRVELFCLGYENAKKRGDEIGLQVFFGWEFNYGATEFLTYGLDKEWLIKHPEIEHMRYPDYLKLIDLHGGFTVHAHPFRQRGYINKLVLVPEYTSAVEIYNDGNDMEIFNERAKWYAESFDLAVTAGSDIHSADGINGVGIEVSEKFDTIFDYIDTVRNRKINIVY